MTARRWFIVVALAATACGPASPSEIDGASPTPIESSSDPGPMSPGSDAPPESEPANDRIEPSRRSDPDWTSITLPPPPATGGATWMTSGWDGGMLVVTGQKDPKGDPDYGIRLVAWHVTDRGVLDERFAGDGSVTIDRTIGYAPFVIGGAGWASDGALLVLTSAVDSGVSGPVVVRRIARDGTLDEAFTQPRNIDDEAQPKLAVLRDGSIRVCRSIRTGTGKQAFTVGVWGYRADGSPDDSVGPDGDKPRAMLAHGRCSAIAATPDGGFVIAAEHDVDEPRSCCDRRELSIVGFSADATERWSTALRLGSPTEEYAPQSLVVTDDSVLVAGWRGKLGARGRSPMHAFVAKARLAGTWDHGFGENGVVSFSGIPVGYDGIRFEVRDKVAVLVARHRPQEADGTYGDTVSSVLAVSTDDGGDVPGFGTLNFDHHVASAGFDASGRLLLWHSPGERAVLERRAFTLA